jgi:simple sugar transport system permease protein
MAVAEATTRDGGASFGWRLLRWFVRRREASVLIIAVGLFVYFWIANSAFVDRADIKNMTEYGAPIALIAAGEVMLLICGEIDLSLGQLYAFGPIIMYLTSNSSGEAVPGATVAGLGLPIWVGVIFALLACAGIGLVTGVITTVFRVPSFITTLGMLFFLNGLNLRLLSGEQIVLPFSQTFQNILGGYGAPNGPFPFYLNSEVYWALFLILLVQFILSYTRWGLHTVATGGNLIGAAESGVNVRKVKIGNFVLAATLAGFAGMMDSERINSIQPLQGGTDIMFLAVAGAVIGGTSLMGGSGTVIGGLLGVSVLVILRTGFIILGVNAYNFDLITGVAIVGAMVLNVQIQRLKNIGKLQ